MSQEKYRTEIVNNITLTAYVWETAEGWASSGVASEDRGNEVREHKVHPQENYYPTKEKAGEAVWQALQDRLVE